MVHGSSLQFLRSRSPRRSPLLISAAALLIVAPSVISGLPAPPAPPSCVSSPFSFSNVTPQGIPNTNVPITSTITVAGAGPYLYDLDVTTFLAHTNSADLDVTLSHGATTVTITTDNGGTLDNVFNGTVWDDDADPDGLPLATFTLNPNQVQVHPYTNNVLATPMTPEEPFAAFLGQDPNGLWTLTVNDDNTTAGTIGTLQLWSMNIVTLATAPTTATPVAGSNSTPVVIPAAGTSVNTSTISISAPGTAILDVNAVTNFTHSFSDDLQFTITSPAGTVVGLDNGIWVSGSGADNVFAGSSWDDGVDPDGTLPYTSNANMCGDHPFADLVVATPLAPIEALGAFIGENPNGTWTLTFADQFDQDGGTMNSWSLAIATASCLPPADVSVTKTNGVASVDPGATTTYTIVVTNAGPNEALSVTVADTFPAELTDCSTTCVESPGSACTNGPFTGNINDSASLPVDATVTYTSICDISSDAAGTLSNTATATVGGSAADPNPLDNTATDSDTINAASADVTITKTDGSTTEIVGTSVTYTIVVTNAGPSDALNVTVADTFATELSGCSTTCVESPGSACTNGPYLGNINDSVSLPEDATVTFTSVCNITSAAYNTLSNTATATVGGTPTDPNLLDNTATDVDLLNVIFQDGFETGDGSRWSFSVPPIFALNAVVTVEAGSSEITVPCNFGLARRRGMSGGTAIAILTDADGRPLARVYIRRVSSGAPIELQLEIPGGARSGWAAVDETSMTMRISWTTAGANSLGFLSLTVDGFLLHGVEGFAPAMAPGAVRFPGD